MEQERRERAWRRLDDSVNAQRDSIIILEDLEQKKVEINEQIRVIFYQIFIFLLKNPNLQKFESLNFIFFEKNRNFLKKLIKNFLKNLKIFRFLIFSIFRM